MHLHDLITDRKTDAGAPHAGAALVEFLFYQRKLVLGNAGAEVPDADDNLLTVKMDIRLNPLARPAVLGGVVQNVQEHLPHSLGVAGNLRNLLVVFVVNQLDAVLRQAAAV